MKVRIGGSSSGNLRNIVLDGGSDFPTDSMQPSSNHSGHLPNESLDVCELQWLQEIGYRFLSGSLRHVLVKPSGLQGLLRRGLLREVSSRRQ